MDIGSLGHNAVFWAQKSSLLDDFYGQKSSQNEDFRAQNVFRVIMTISGVRNHHSVMISGPINRPFGKISGPRKI